LVEGPFPDGDIPRVVLSPCSRLDEGIATEASILHVWDTPCPGDRPAGSAGFGRKRGGHDDTAHRNLRIMCRRRNSRLAIGIALRAITPVPCQSPKHARSNQCHVGASLGRRPHVLSRDDSARHAVVVRTLRLSQRRASVSDFPPQPRPGLRSMTRVWYKSPIADPLEWPGPSDRYPRSDGS
jgi:hypothetical protein